MHSFAVFRGNLTFFCFIDVCLLTLFGRDNCICLLVATYIHRISSWMCHTTCYSLKWRREWKLFGPVYECWIQRAFDFHKPWNLTRPWDCKIKPKGLLCIMKWLQVLSPFVTATSWCYAWLYFKRNMFVHNY